MKKLFITCIFIIPILVKSQIPIFCDTILYTSYYNETKFRDKITHQSEVVFSFNRDIIATTMKDQMSRYRSYGIVEEGNDKQHIWKKHQCLDNSGSKMYITFAYEKSSNVQIIIIDYGSMYMYFEVISKPIPEKVYDVLDNLESLGYFGDENFGSAYSNEEVDNFLSQFGNPDLIMKLLVSNIFIDNIPNVTTEKFDSNGIYIGKEIQYNK